MTATDPLTAPLIEPHPLEVRRVLDPVPVRSLEEHQRLGGGVALTAARTAPDGVIPTIDAAGLRGRGGAGFPTATKWAAVVEHMASGRAPRVVVNAAEGEPWSFKDRAVLRMNPYRVLEGALAAATVVGATEVVVALKASFHEEIARVRAAVSEIDDAGWADGRVVRVFEGPTDYLYGEETALLEAIDGRDPEPRVNPPYRRGVGDGAGPGGDASEVDLAATEVDTDAAPALVNNVETFAQAALILTHGADWFRDVGTEDSPGTIVCTVSGATRRDAVGEFALGTPLAEIIEVVGGGARDGRTLRGALSGVSNPILPAALLPTAATYEAMDEAGSGLGACGWVVFDDEDDLVSVAASVSRFLATESCGQCEPCKVDGSAIADRLERLQRREPQSDDMVELETLLARVTTGARCYLATQQQQVVTSLLSLFPDDVLERTGAGTVAADHPVGPIASLVDGVATIDTSWRDDG